MGKSGEVEPSESEKSSSPAMAFYGPRFPVPPYMNSAVASPHAPLPYMWPPPQATATWGTEKPAKSSGNTDGGFAKKLKELDLLAMSIGNGNGDSADPGTERTLSDSDETDGSSDGVKAGAGRNGKKRSRQGSPNRGDSKAHRNNNVGSAVEVGGASKKMIDVIPAANNTPVKTTANSNTALELKNVKSSPNNVRLQSVTNEAWMQNDRELKREKRKQSNRESARRSRLRKQAESEELAVKVQALTAENTTLKSELNKLMENSEQLKLEHAALIEKLKDDQLGQTDVIDLVKIDDQLLKPIGTANLLARVNSNPADRRTTATEDGDTQENRSPRAKLRQLLDASPRKDAVAAG